jgi:hypothetical protein
MTTNSSGRLRPGRAGRAIMIALATLIGAPALAADAFIPRLLNTSTVPSNGDLNPYGVAFVPEGFPSGGRIRTGDVLVSNFNDNANIQGNGTTVISFSPGGPVAAPGTANTFFSSTAPGLSTALGVLRGGFVVVGNVPTTGGAFPVLQGALQVIDRNGELVQTLTDATFLDGPWDLTLDDHGTSAHIFVSNVANGTVSRLDVTVGSKGLTVTRMVTLSQGYTVRANVAAVILDRPAWRSTAQATRSTSPRPPTTRCTRSATPAAPLPPSPGAASCSRIHTCADRSPCASLRTVIS